MPVKVAAVELKPMPVDLKAVGTMEAASTVAVSAQVAGLITAVHFAEGDEVKEGQLLFSLDARPYHAALSQAEAKLVGNRALAKKAEEDLKRYSALVERELASREQFEGVRANVESLRAAVLASEADAESARLMLAYCTIRAPVSGRTGSLLVHAGNVVGPAASPPQPLVVILQQRPIRVSFAVSERYLDVIRENARREHLAVSVHPAASTAPPSVGSLEFLDNTVDHMSGTIKLKAIFVNEDGALWPGQFVDVVVRLAEQADAVVVPTPAVQSGQQGSYVFVAKSDDTVELRPVTVDRVVGVETVIAEGVAAQEIVVTDGQLRLLPGSKIVVAKAPASSPQP